MATFEAQVSGLTSLTIDDSSSPTRAELNQFLTDGAKEVINNLPGHLLPLCSSSVSFTSGSASTLNTGKILNVFRSDGDITQPCRKIPAKQKGRVSDPEEMSYATITDPIYYIDNNSLDVLPDGGTCTYSEVQYPTVSYTHDAISVFPDEAEYLVVLYGAVKSLQNKMGSKTSDLPSDISFPSISIAPASPSFDIGAISISSSAPSYTKLFVVRVAFSGYTSGLSESDPGVLSVSAVIPVVPSLTSVTFTSIDSALDALAPIYTTATVSASSVYTGNAPSYTAPVLSLTAFPTITWTFPSVSITPVSPSFTTPAIGAIAVASTTLSNIGTPPTYTSPTVAGVTEELTAAITNDTDADASKLDFSDWFEVLGDMIQTDEDTELASAQTQKISTYLRAYQEAMTNNLNTYNKENVAYQAKLQEAIQQARINSEKAQAQAQIDATDAQQEASLKLQKENQEYGASLQNFSASVQNYQAEVNKIVTGNQAEIGEWQQRNSVEIQKYGTDVQSAVNTFNKENIAYQSAIQESMQEIQIANQVNIAQSQSDLQTATSNKDRDQQRQLQNGTNDMQAIINDNNRKISLYQAKIQTYQADVNKQVQEYGQKLSQYQLELNTAYQAWAKTESDSLNQYQSDIQNELNEFNKEQVVFQNELQEKIQEANNQQTKDSSEYSAKLQKYSAEVQLYSAEVNEKIQDFNTKLQKHSTDYQWLQSQYVQLKSDYTVGLQMLGGGSVSPPQR